jgi:eukaryotic-like serine/threonine-protein kinase
MIGNTAVKFDDLSLPEAELVDAACDRFESVWRAGDRPRIEGYLDAVPEPCRTILFLELLKRELELRVREGERPNAAEYCPRFPDQAPAVVEILQAMRKPENGLSSWPDDNRQPGEGQPPDRSNADASTIDLVPGQLIDPAQLDRAIGRQLGDYLILNRLGSGGMGVVYRALQRSAGRFVALKLIKADWWGDSTDGSSHEAETRFRNEAQAHAQLDHDHIVPIYDVGHIGGILFFSMRLIKGRSLGQVLLSDGPLSPRRAASYIEPIARAIQYAHDHRVLHRDVKPGNILVDEHDRPYLIDLGLAKCLEATDYSTLSGKALGTAEYMSPEQARGQNEVGFTSDVYSLGATLFTLLTGGPPFTGPNPIAVLRQVIDDEPVWPRARNKPVGPELKAICLKCLEKDPDRRIASAGELAGELGKYLRYERCKYTLPGPWTRLTKWARRQPWRAVAAGLAVVAVLVVATAWTWTARRDRATADALIHDLRTIPIDALPRKIKQMAGYRSWINPKLHAMLSSVPESRTRVLLALLPIEPQWANQLADRLLTCADPDEHKVIREALFDRWPDLAPRLRQVLIAAQPDPGRRTRAAAALIALDGPKTITPGAAEEAWSGLKSSGVPDSRTELLDWLVRSKVDPEVLAARLETELDPSVRRQLIQALGALGQGQVPAGVSAAMTARLTALYRDDPDAGVHSSIAYLLRRWGMNSVVQRIDAALAGKPHDGYNWYVNPARITMAILTVPDYDNRPLPPEPGAPPARFAIATTETPLALFQQFDPTHAARRREEYKTLPETDPEAPADVLNYYEAARFCNWLSEREHIPPDQWCYRDLKSNGLMVLSPDYPELRGYRLPTVPEWEFAARAGTITNRYFGQNSTFIDDYVWHNANSGFHTQPIGRLRPNDFGLFDVLGNVCEWCRNPTPVPHPACTSCPPGKEPDPPYMRLESLKGRHFSRNPEDQVLRGEPFRVPPDFQPEIRFIFSGFRVVKNEF